MRVIALLTLALVAGGCAAHAIQVGPAAPGDRDRARTLARTAYDRVLHADDDPAVLRDAIALTKRAYAIDHDPLYLCNVGGYYRLLEDWPRAASFLGRCLQLLPATRPDEGPRFRAVLDEVEHHLAQDHVAILVDVQPAALIRVSTFAADELVPAPALIWLPVGKHEIIANVPGQGTQRKTIAVTPAMIGESRRVALRSH